MNARRRVQAVFQGAVPDRLPRFEVWIDALFAELGVSDPYRAYPELGQDGILMPSHKPRRSNAWADGVDEFGRVWRQGMYAGGVLSKPADLVRYSPPAAYAGEYFDPARVAQVRAAYPDHCLFFGTHAGPFMGAYMALGLENLSLMLREDPAFVHAVMRSRTDWCLALFRRALDLGAELIVMGDDAAHAGGPLISPRVWREFVLPYHQEIVRELDAPVVWHSDGNLAKLLPFAVEAGFAGVHGLEPRAGNRLAEVKAQYGSRLVLMGNLDVNVLFDLDLGRVRAEVERCCREGGEQGYMISTCNSIFPGMNPAAVREFFRLQAER